MKIKLLLLVFLMSTSFAMSQGKALWQKQPIDNNLRVKPSKQDLPRSQTFSLNTEGLRQALEKTPKRGDLSKSSNVVLSFPNANGEFERFRVFEASVMDTELAARYPEIKSYAGQGIDDPTAIIRFSVTPLGFQSIRFSANKPASFIEAVTEDASVYSVFTRANKLNVNNDFECSVTESMNRSMNSDSGMSMRNADDSILRTYRLVVSATGEYTNYHGGTKALALAAIVQTMTRVNGIFETDFNVTMILINNTDDVIFTNSGSDPYTTTGSYNGQLQSELTSTIGEANYDVGHLFANLQNNGNAGCIGCVCVNNQKGSGWTSATVPTGEFFDVDYVAHEMGHQFGANHTWTHGGNEGTNVQMEPGSGTTIMSYAGITGATDVEPNVHPNFHAASIEQVTDYVKSTSCQTNTNTGNAVPSVNAGSNYTIPNGTAFVLDGSATDADTAAGALTYSWEQMDENNASSTYPSTTATTGVAFRAYEPTTSTSRYFPRLSTIKTGATSWQWEAVPNVARSLNFRLTVRDNVAGGGTNSSDDMVVTVNGTAGPFVLNSPNTNVTWDAGTTQTVTWNVAGTTGNGVNAANVDIFLSTDGGDTYSVSLASGVTNDGSHDIVVPNSQGNQNRVMVRGANNIFFDISNTNFTIGAPVVCNADVPTGLGASNVSTTSATISWTAVPGASYDLRYREVGASTWITTAVNGISLNATGLTALTQYEAQVRSKCSGGSNSVYSSSVNFTTTDVQLNYCASASTNINDEYIGRVQLNTIDNASGGQFYTDFTSISTTLTIDTQYTITVTPTWTGTVYSEGYAVWIDYNRDGDFGDAGELVWSQAATQSTPVSGSFTIPSGAVENSTRMRVSMKYNGIPTECETFQYGEVEDYTVVIEGNGPDTEAPVISLNGASTLNLNVGETYSELGATATDNIDGNLTSSIIIGGDTVNTSLGGTYVVTYNVSDAAGNAASEVIRTVNVIPDTTAPVITIIGSANISLELGDSYSDQGATASDNIDGDLTSSINVGGDTVDTNVVGLYTITYNVSDAAGNAATQVTRTVTVNPDTTAPVITLNGASTINLNIGDSYIEQGATATDNLDGNLTSSIVTTGAVNTTIAGTYFVNYNVSDSSGNAATQVTRTINVAEDITPPVIVLVGASTINLNVGDTYSEQGATATDNIDGNLTSSIVTSGTVNTASAGTYFVNYNVSDSSGNAAAQVTRTVNVAADTTPPVIVLVGASTINLLVGDTYSEQGATASDNIDGNLTSSIVTTGSVNTSLAGTYFVNYNVSDAAGNAAAQVTRTVNVSDPSTGCSGGITSYPYSEGFEGSFGAWSQSTADDIDWAVNSGTTPSSGTGPSSANQGSSYIYVEASGNGTGYPDKRAILTSPCFDLSAVSTPTFSFDYHMFGAANMGSIDLELSDDDGASWTSIWNQTGNQGDQWNTIELDFSAYAGSNVQLRFNRFVGNTWQADIAIDNINLLEPVAPTCNDGIQNGDETGVDCGGSSCSPCSTSDVVLNKGYFETGWDGWVDGGSDSFRYTGTRSYEGSYSIRLRDNTSSSVMTLSNIDVTPYSQVVVDFYFYVFSMESGEDFWLQFYDGSSYITAATWVAGSGIENSNFYNATITLTPSEYNFAVNSGFRFRNDASGNQDYIHIDQVTITGTNSSRGEINNLAIVGSLNEAEISEMDLRIHPNPVKGDILNVELSEGGKFEYVIKNMLGQIITKGNSTGQIKVSSLEAGMYFIEVNDGDEILTKKFIRN
ncbi:immunoglobulin-like domain-containing protein [Psychroserpens jangbogonensis]|uniref:immunoglobulin-like domain-containing protein n=1 Tax=Psychroserpens jangbogonensis TaxID=1484460 RepID=UPI0009E033B7|nr:immunoglobulin-like domain-containing protein [Psychroserpens jangbogonensis]